MAFQNFRVRGCSHSPLNWYLRSGSICINTAPEHNFNSKVVRGLRVRPYCDRIAPISMAASSLKTTERQACSLQMLCCRAHIRRVCFCTRLRLRAARSIRNYSTSSELASHCVDTHISSFSSTLFCNSRAVKCGSETDVRPSNRVVRIGSARRLPQCPMGFAVVRPVVVNRWIMHITLYRDIFTILAISLLFLPC